MEFKLHRLSDYSDEALIAELRRVAESVPSGALTRAVFDANARASASTVIKRFGGWKEALEAAGLLSRYGGQPVTDRMRRQPGKSTIRERVIEELRTVASKLGRPDFTVEEFNTHAPFSAGPVRSHFKTWRAALEAAGLRAGTHSIRYSDEECFENLLKVWTHFGRPPRYRDMCSPPSTVGGKAYVGRWGTWVKALEAFVERVNSDSVQDPPTSEPAPATLENKLQSDDERDDRRIRLGLRYRTLVRDSVKCVLCGASPATDPLCKLHIDHVLPHSKGGATALENLRTLCECCNLGKSNLMIEEAH